MPVCPYCGVEYDQHTLFCMRCGERLPPQGAPPPRQRRWDTPSKPPYHPYPSPRYPIKLYHPSMKAPLFERCVAVGIDWIITVTLMIIIIYATGMVFSVETGAFIVTGATFATPFLAYGYFAVKDCIRGGRSIGKGIMGLRVVDLNSGRPATFIQSSLRNCCCGWCDWYCCYFTALLNSDRRRIGDQVAGTVVIRDQ